MMYRAFSLWLLAFTIGLNARTAIALPDALRPHQIAVDSHHDFHHLPLFSIQ